MNNSKYDYREMTKVWARLKPRKRTALLKRLGAEERGLARCITLKGAACTKHFAKLPTPIKALLVDAFNGTTFSRAEQRRRAVTTRVLLTRQDDKVEQEYENTHDFTDTQQRERINEERARAREVENAVSQILIECL